MSASTQDKITRRFQAQKNRTLRHLSLPQTIRPLREASNYTFVVAADTQFGMAKHNKDWSEEKEYSRQAVSFINQLDDSERPLFCCICGDLVHMTAEIYATTEPNDKDSDSNKQEKNKNGPSGPGWTREECDKIQDVQVDDFQSIWSQLHLDVALVCLCGNHDVGDRPTPTSIQRFQTKFGDDYLAFWAKRSYHIVVNTSLFSDPSGAPELFQEQFKWLEERLQYASKERATHIFVFGHHPWFLYDPDEDERNMPGYSPVPKELGAAGGKIDDSYFVIPKAVRQKVLALFQTYRVNAAFCGHFHQNWVTKTSFGMDLIVTAPLSVVLGSTGIPETFLEPKTKGLRMVNVRDDGSFGHKFTTI